MLMEETMELEKEIKLLVNLTIKELVTKYHKKSDVARKMVYEMDVYNLIMEKPVRLHDAPEKWAIKVLTYCNDVEAIENYYL
ncbi:hypothetical protein [Bacillus sp. FDAARGOS_235]|uniref:hypothetical protein n=1 Tax=Bacillus sp. FDAARGOS_235 TaxID=1839798 RepID=UPI0011A62EB1|nr:hypothetical protein [Bacillus sp. FDAARGOS_235]